MDLCEGRLPRQIALVYALELRLMDCALFFFWGLYPSSCSSATMILHRILSTSAWCSLIWQKTSPDLKPRSTLLLRRRLEWKDQSSTGSTSSAAAPFSFISCAYRYRNLTLGGDSQSPSILRHRSSTSRPSPAACRELTQMSSRREKMSASSSSTMFFLPRMLMIQDQSCVSRCSLGSVESGVGYLRSVTREEFFLENMGSKIGLQQQNMSQFQSFYWEKGQGKRQGQGIAGIAYGILWYQNYHTTNTLAFPLPFPSAPLSTPPCPPFLICSCPIPRQFYNQTMNDYLTPRRRHSSLFQRMEDEIIKISRKLSAAKQHKTGHTAAQDNFQRQQNESPGLTVRRVKETPTAGNSKELTRKYTTGLADRTNLQPRNRQPIRRLKFSHGKIDDLMDLGEGEESSEVQRLAQQNRQLQSKLKQIKAICEQQSFKLGFLRAENQQVTSQLQSARFDSYREQLYLSKLLQGYKIKVSKYKRMLNEQQSLSIDLQDL